MDSDAADFVENLITAGWTASNTDSVTPKIEVGYDVRARERCSRTFKNGGDIIYVKEIQNSFVSKPLQLYGGGVSTSVRVNIHALTRASSASVDVYVHGRKLIQECQRLMRASEKPTTTYDQILIRGGSNECNITNNFAKYRLEVELRDYNVPY